MARLVHMGLDLRQHVVRRRPGREAAIVGDLRHPRGDAETSRMLGSAG